MSGISVIYNLDGRPVEPAPLRRMTDAICHRGVDASGEWIDGPVALAHRMFWTTPESLREKQPWRDDSADLTLAMDGRVDNRDELRRAVQARGMVLRTDTDAELVIRAYQCWDYECPRHIIGDFAFALWDGCKRELFCARDVLGVRPFYFYADGRTFLCTSELHQLLEHDAVPRQPNEGMVAEYLAASPTSLEKTLFKGILRLPPAHCLRVNFDGLRRFRYWDVDAAKQISYSTDDEYAEHFFDIFQEAVRSRLRSSHRLGSELSGGLDSSSIVSMMGWLRERGDCPNTGFETFSMVFPGSACDERDYVAAVTKRWGFPPNLVPPQVSGPSFYVEQARRYKDFPDYPNSVMSYGLHAAASRKGFRVLLGGDGGDQWLDGSCYHYADLLRRMRIGDAIRQARCDARTLSAGRVARPLFQYGILPLIPESVKSRLRRPVTPEWIDERWAAAMCLSERLRRRAALPEPASFAQRDLYRTLTDGWSAHGNETGDRALALLQIEERHPLDDRRIIEFAMALPEPQRRRGNQRRFILRSAMRRLLPESVRRRVTKADFSHVFAESLGEPEGERLFDSLAISEAGWVSAAGARTKYRKMLQLYRAGDEGYAEHVWPVWMIFGIEIWYRTVFLERDGQHCAA
jgi:asparagine synthase (glutamine-hydrolysing)